MVPFLIAGHILWSLITDQCDVQTLVLVPYFYQSFWQHLMMVDDYYNILYTR